MGVDYTGNFGIGFKIDNNIDFDEDPRFCDYDCMTEYIEDKIHEDYNFFEVGNGAYTGEEDDFYVVLKNPFKNGCNLIKAKGDLREYIALELNLDIDGDFDCFGGIRMW